MNKEYKLSSCIDIMIKGINVQEDTESGIEYYDISMKNFYGNDIKISDEKKTNGKEDQIKLKRLRKGDIIMPSRATVSNKIAVFNLDTTTPCIVNHQYWIIRPEKDLIDSYYLLFFLLNTKNKEILNTHEKNQTKTGIPNISALSLKELSIELPSLDIQSEYKKIFDNSQELFNIIKNTEVLHQNFYDNVNKVDNPNLIIEKFEDVNDAKQKLYTAYNELTSKLNWDMMSQVKF